MVDCGRDGCVDGLMVDCGRDGCVDGLMVDCGRDGCVDGFVAFPLVEFRCEDTGPTELAEVEDFNLLETF